MMWRKILLDSCVVQQYTTSSAGKKEEGRIVFVAMSIPDYELMSYNMQELKRYINELKEVVVYYRKVTTKETE